MTISLTGVAASTTPTVVKTFFKHYKTQWTKDKEDRWTEPTDEILFHEAFAIVKRFIGIATTDTVESLQRFTNTHVPAQPGTTALRALIPLESCDQAAKLLIEYFGDDDLRNLVGGALWWQVRGLRGVQAEWIAMRKDWNRATAVEKHLAEGDTNHDLIKMAKKVRPDKRHERKRSFAAPIRKSLDRRRSDKTVKAAAVSAAKTRESGTGKGKADGKDSKNDKDTDKDNNDKRIDDKHPLDEGKDEPSESFEELDRLKRVMYYIHGGGYYFGSISTHRLMITRFARKFGGRAFAVNYRKAPQYPWPCAVQDVLAGYLYLIRPPPGARHQAIDPKHIVVAGDSAGGGLCLALLCVLRDLNLPMPSGGVLLSPWCDMTHSFPSVLQKTASDIIPTYGFIHKPSTVWPVPNNLTAETSPTEENSQQDDHKDNERKQKQQQRNEMQEGHKDEDEQDIQASSKDAVDKVAQQGKAASKEAQLADATENKGAVGKGPAELSHLPEKEYIIMMQDKHGKEVPFKLTRQIQLYAMNAQLFHPLCSPVLSGSLGGLPPLYILAGDGEVLRDEIIYLAHRAAHPQEYPLKSDLLHANKRAEEIAQKYNDCPTKVHLQVYDGQPHVLTLFSFTTSARYAYRAIASFVKHVTGAPTNHINPFPNLTMAESGQSEAPSAPDVHETTRQENDEASYDRGALQHRQQDLQPLDTSVDSKQSSLGPINESPLPTSTVTTTDSNNTTVSDGKGREGSNKGGSSRPVDAPADSHTQREKRRRNVTLGSENAYDGQVPLRRPSFVQEMIRERVDIRGRIRPLEKAEALQALQMSNEQIGTFKSGTVQRYLTGQTRWDERFKKQTKRVLKQRQHNKERVRIMLEQAQREGLLGDLPLTQQDKADRVLRRHGDPNDASSDDHDGDNSDSDDGWADLVRLGPLALSGETPPPSAIAGRQDTEEGIELLRQALHMRAERMGISEDATARVSLGMPFSRRRDREKIRYRSANGSLHKQSAAERQVNTDAKYGLKAFANAMSFFGRRREHQAAAANKRRNAQEKNAAKAKANENVNANEHRRNTSGSSNDDDHDAASWIDDANATGGANTPRAPTINGSTFTNK